MRKHQVEILLIGDLYKLNNNNCKKEDNNVDLPKPFMDLITNRRNEIDYILCTGNIGDENIQKFLKNNCKQYLQTKGDKDDIFVNNGSYRKSAIKELCGNKLNLIENFYGDIMQKHCIDDRDSFKYKRHRKILTMTDLISDKKNKNVIITDKEIINVSHYKIGLLHGHNITTRDYIFGRISPCLDKDELLHLQKEMDVDILVFGHTNRMSIEFDKENKKIFINTGSMIGNDTILTTSPLLILNWVRKYKVIPINYQFPIPIMNMIINYGKQTWNNQATFASLIIEHSPKMGQKCTVFAYTINEHSLSKQKIGQFEDLYNYKNSLNYW